MNEERNRIRNPKYDICSIKIGFPREAAKKVLFLVSGQRRGGEVLNGCATKEKRTFFNVRKKVPMAAKPGGGGGAKVLSGRATKKQNFFCGFPKLVLLFSE